MIGSPACAARQNLLNAMSAIAELAAFAVEGGGHVGVMFHHAEMDRSELEGAAELLTVLAEHERTRCVRMKDAVAPPGKCPA